MVAGNDLTEVLQTLRARRVEHVAVITEHQSAVERIDKAIEALAPLAGDSSAPLDTSTVFDPARDAPSKSVFQYAIDLLNEGPETWTADEILAEYERRGTPITVMDPRNAMFSALSRAHKKNLLVRVGRGRYRSRKFFPEVPPATPDPVDLDNEEVTDTA